MVKRTQAGVWCTATLLVLTALAGCSGDDPPEDKRAESPVDAAPADETMVGSFVGEVSGTRAFVAIVAEPADGDGTVEIYISDGRAISEWFSGVVSGDGFEAQSDDGDAQAEGALSGDSVTGTVTFPGGESATYRAAPPSGAAGLYELAMAPGGEVSGASAAGLAMRGKLALGRRTTGRLVLVDGNRLELALTRKRRGELAHLRAGHVRLIVLSDGALRGAVKSRASKGGRSDYLIRSA